MDRFSNRRSRRMPRTDMEAAKIQERYKKTVLVVFERGKFVVPPIHFLFTGTLGTVDHFANVILCSLPFL